MDKFVKGARLWLKVRRKGDPVWIDLPKSHQELLALVEERTAPKRKVKS